MRRPEVDIRLFALAAAMLGLVACGRTQSPNFYLLESPLNQRLTGVQRGVAVGVGPIQMPEYLDRPQVVTRTSGNRLGLSEFHQWSEPLKVSVSRVIAVNLSNLLESTRIFILPRRKKPPLDYSVAIDVARFDGAEGGEVVLVARWTVYGKTSQDVLLTRVSLVTEQSAAGGIEGVIAVQNRALEVLSREIAEAIKSKMQ